MKNLIVMAAGLGYEGLEKRGLLKLAGLDFKPATSVFPAVTCTAQASFRTASGSQSGSALCCKAAPAAAAQSGRNGKSSARSG